jgi:TatA/E family protein of Tat protein translocase
MWPQSGFSIAFGLGNPIEWIVLFIVALIVFGPDKLPDVGRQLGKAMRDLRKLTDEITGATHSIRREFEDATGDVRRSVEQSYRSVMDQPASGQIKSMADVREPMAPYEPGADNRPPAGLKLSTAPRAGQDDLADAATSAGGDGPTEPKHEG